jgi:hypothetical protein
LEKRDIAFVLLGILVFGGIAVVGVNAIVSFTATGSQTVNPTPAYALTIGGDVNDDPGRFIVNGNTATLTLPDLTVGGNTTTVHVGITNTGTASALVTVTASSSNSSVASLTTVDALSFTLAAGGGNRQLTFTVSPLTVGTTTISIGVSAP